MMGLFLSLLLPVSRKPPPEIETGGGTALLRGHFKVILRTDSLRHEDMWCNALFVLLLAPEGFSAMKGDMLKRAFFLIALHFNNGV